ncbi:MAG: sugar phosphate isomerase/epimerase [Lachnospiraceae bacterium]|nr:sugar phosphate isomerase/epimerase [Lachnospiraceae bacterium]
MKYSLMTTTMVLDLLSESMTGIPKLQIQKKYADMMEMIASIGISAVEITTLELDLFGMDVVKQILNESHLKAGGFVHMDTFAHTDSKISQELAASAMRRIDDALCLGADNLMLGLMAQDDVSAHSPEELTNALIQNIRPVAEYGMKKGIKISVEDTPDIRLPLCDTADTKILLDAIPELYLTFDTGNMLLKHDAPLSYLEAFQDRICNVHLKDICYPAPGQPGDTDVDGKVIAGCQHGCGLIDFAKIGNRLKSMNYNGNAVIEYIGHSRDNHAVRIREAYLFLQDQIG